MPGNPTSAKCAGMKEDLGESMGGRYGEQQGWGVLSPPWDGFISTSRCHAQLLGAVLGDVPVSARAIISGLFHLHSFPAVVFLFGSSESWFLISFLICT
jgi:hypothetical protein